ncbi:MAG: PIN domain-containing protein [Pirellulales bacterium]
MIFDDIPDGASLFIDANTFVYAFSKHAQLGVACSELMERIDEGDVAGFTSTHVLSETAHRLMTLEACALFGWPFAGIANRLKQRPAELQQLSAHQRAIDDILQSQIQILTIQPQLVLTATRINQQFGLLSNDALIVAIMQAQSLTAISSHDTDFDRVPWIVRYAPV